MNRVWIARDRQPGYPGLEASLTVFQHQPRLGDEIWLPRDSMPGWFRKLPGSWFPEIKPGQCRAGVIALEPPV